MACVTLGAGNEYAIGKNAIFDSILAMKINVLAVDGVFDTGLATVLDAFQTANELAEMSGITAQRFEISIVGTRRVVKTSQGLTVPVQAAQRCGAPDCVIVPAPGFKMPAPLQAALVRADVRDAVEILASGRLEERRARLRASARLYLRNPGSWIIKLRPPHGGCRPCFENATHTCA